MVVQSLMAEHGMSQRRACQASGIARSTLRYRAATRDDSGVITFIQAYMAINPRHDFGLLYDSARGAVARVLRAAVEPAPAWQEATACTH